MANRLALFHDGRMIVVLRYLWASPATLVGLACALAAIASGAKARRVDGTLEVGGGRVRDLVLRLPEGCRFGAITLGHVIVGLDAEALARSRAHERVHVRQYERWGVLFFPLYAASSFWALVRGRDPYRDNRFEREAFARERTAE
jgi:hypothetical protein